MPNVPATTRSNHYDVAMDALVASGSVGQKIQLKLPEMKERQALAQSQLTEDEATVQAIAAGNGTIDNADLPKYHAWAKRLRRWVSIGAGQSQFRAQEEKCARVALGQIEAVLDDIAFAVAGLTLAVC